jgi:hypothetical protein
MVLLLGFGHLWAYVEGKISRFYGHKDSAERGWQIEIGTVNWPRSVG